MILEVKAMVAAWDEKRAWVIAGSDQVTSDLAATSPDVDDIGLGRPPADGLWMWEGTAHVDVDGDATYKGEYRRPTDAEALAVACGENPLMPPCGT